MLRIDILMRKNGISTRELADMMNVTPQYVSEIVNERKNITLSSLSKFAEALCVPIAALMDGYHDNGDLGGSFKCPYCVNVISVVKEE